MMWNGFGWGGLAILGILMCVAMMVMMMGHGSFRHTHQPSSRDADTPEREDAPESILARRLARGEIDVAEYQRLHDALKRTGDTPPGAAGSGRDRRSSST